MEEQLSNNSLKFRDRKEKLMRFLTSLFDFLKTFLLALVIVLPIRYFLFQPFMVRGESMFPNFRNGDYLIVDEISYRFSQPQRGDVIVFKYPKDKSQRFIKRIVGLPGETVEIKDGRVKIINKDNQEIFLSEIYLPQGVQTVGDVIVRLGPGEYFVLGDNRNYSYDSRVWGALPQENIIGKVFLRVFSLPSWPFSAQLFISK